MERQQSTPADEKKEEQGDVSALLEENARLKQTCAELSERLSLCRKKHKNDEEEEGRCIRKENGTQEEGSFGEDEGEGKMKEKRFGESELTAGQIERYSRQCFLEEFRPAGTAKLIKSKVLVVGAGGLGSSVAMYLATAGVGYLRIVDHDRVERSNLHRQIIHTDARCGLYKAHSARAMLNELNPLVTVEPIIDSFRLDNALSLLAGVDVVVDATDNVASRYLINDACVVRGLPLVSGSAMRWEGQLTVYGYSNGSSGGGGGPHTKGNDPATPAGGVTTPSGAAGPCYRCMFPRPPPPAAVGSCNDSGVVGVLPGTIGCLQALETQKILMRTGEVLSGRMLHFNGLNSTFRVMKMRGRQANCVVCGDNPTITEAIFINHYAECGATAANGNKNTASTAATEATTGTTAVVVPPSGLFGEYDAVGTCGRRRPVEGEISVRDFAQILCPTTTTGTGATAAACSPSPSSSLVPIVVLDVRVTTQYELCPLTLLNSAESACSAGAGPNVMVNIPAEALKRDVERVQWIIQYLDHLVAKQKKREGASLIPATTTTTTTDDKNNNSSSGQQAQQSNSSSSPLPSSPVVFTPKVPVHISALEELVQAVAVLCSGKCTTGDDNKSTGSGKTAVHSASAPAAVGSKRERNNTDIVADKNKCKKVATTTHHHHHDVVYVICRRGIASVEVVELLHNFAKQLHRATNTGGCCALLSDSSCGVGVEGEGEGKDQLEELHRVRQLCQPVMELEFVNVTGGLLAWSSAVDPTFPAY